MDYLLLCAYNMEFHKAKLEALVKGISQEWVKDIIKEILVV